MEAEIKEEERAMASVNVYKEPEDQCRDSEYKERLAELIPEEPLHPTEQQTMEAAQSQLIQPHEQSMQHLEAFYPTQHQKREAAQPQLKPLEQPVPVPLEKVPEFIDNDRVRISGIKACETVSTPAPNPVFSVTGRTIYADEDTTCRHADQPYNLKDTETLKTTPVNPPVLRNTLQRVQVLLISLNPKRSHGSQPRCHGPRPLVHIQVNFKSKNQHHLHPVAD